MAFSEGPFQFIRSIPSDDDPTVGPGRYFHTTWEYNPRPGAISPYVVSLTSERHRSTPAKRPGEFGAIHSHEPYMIGLAGYCVTFVTNGVGGYLMNVYNRNLSIRSQVPGLVPGPMFQIGPSRFILRQPGRLVVFQIVGNGLVYQVAQLTSIDVFVDGELVPIDLSSAALVPTNGGGLYVIKYVKTKSEAPPAPDYSGPFGRLQEIIDQLYPPSEERTIYHAFAELSPSFSVVKASQIVGFPHQSTGRLERTTSAFFWYVQGRIYKIVDPGFLSEIHPFAAPDIDLGKRLGEIQGLLWNLATVDTGVDGKLPMIIGRNISTLDLERSYRLDHIFRSMPSDGIGFVDSNMRWRFVLYRGATGMSPFTIPGRQSELVLVDGSLVEARFEDFPSWLGPRRSSFVYAGGEDPWRVNLAPLVRIRE